MVIYTLLSWLMFLGLFPVAFFWLRRAWLIGVKKDYSYVALKRGVPPKNPGKYVAVSVGINFLAGTVLVMVVFLIIATGLDFDKWTAIAGSTIWMKFIFEFILSQQAHAKWKNNDPKC